jgi:hypothetical protein
LRSIGAHVFAGEHFDDRDTDRRVKVCALHKNSCVMEEGWNTSVGRREFVRALAGAFVFAFAGVPGDVPFKLGILRDSPRTSFDDGVALGLDEATRAAALFGRTLLQVISGNDLSSLIRNGVQAVIGASRYPAASEVAERCNTVGCVYLNCGARANDFRKACEQLLFHIEASDAMYSDAEVSSPGSDVVLWHATLEKYGAAQLNDRFRAASRHSMDGKAWCGWFAVKLVVESVLRAKVQTGMQLGAHLTQDSTHFDGHKGAPLSFRAWDHQLRQPLYAVSKGKPPKDVPDISRSGNSIRDLLDSIGEKSNTCGKSQ